MLFGASRKAERFQRSRSPQDDASFVRACGYEAGSPEASLALTIRRVIGECGCVDPGLIRAEDRWPEDLGGLSFWDSIDYIHFLLSIERTVGVKIPGDGGLATFFGSGFTVAGLISQFKLRSRTIFHET